MFVTVVIARQDDELGAELPRPDGRHGGKNAKLAGFVRSGSDDAALLPAHGHGFAAQFRVRRLLYSGEESVCIEMNYGAWRRHNSARPRMRLWKGQRLSYLSFFCPADQRPKHALDHQFLNEIEGLENPTSENLCRWIWARLQERLPGLSRVVVNETCTTGCHYDGRE